MALIAHTFAKPYEDPIVDLAEFFALVSIQLVALSAMVFAVLDDPMHPDQRENARFISKLCENLSIVVLVLNVVLVVFVQFMVMHRTESCRLPCLKQKVSYWRPGLPSTPMIRHQIQLYVVCGL